MNYGLSGFSGGTRRLLCATHRRRILEIPQMFVFDRSAFAVLLPLLLLAGVVVWSKAEMTPPRAEHRSEEQARERPAAKSPADQTVAASLPSR
jgi:hypothetical protein